MHLHQEKKKFTKPARPLLKKKKKKKDCPNKPNNCLIGLEDMYLKSYDDISYSIR